ncbi:hypothetical protein [Gemmatimonas sp.]|uniref:hypothetical protein n=1 Tax=Gemmatimonas sp. TaxID=1962908 RepID=UPI0035632798
MAPIVLNNSMIQSVRPIREHGPFPVFAPGDAVQFQLSVGTVRARVSGIDVQARKDLPLGMPYRLTVIEAPPLCGYSAGADCTIRAACLQRDGEAPDAVAVVAAPVAPQVTTPTFLVAYMREGGNFPIQGTLLVQGATLDAANAAATKFLNDELAEDVREGRELPEAMVILLNASEVPMPATDVPVVASVSW